MRKVRINVTQKDIDSGKMGCETRCPIARATLRKFKSTTVREGEIVIERKSYKLPNNATNFISIYDLYGASGPYGEAVKPFSFTLNIRD